MSIKKYRLFLLMIMMVVIIVGALSLLYFSEDENWGQEGTLVMQELSLEHANKGQTEYEQWTGGEIQTEQEIRG